MTNDPNVNVTPTMDNKEPRTSQASVADPITPPASDVIGAVTIAVPTDPNDRVPYGPVFSTAIADSASERSILSFCFKVEFDLNIPSFVRQYLDIDEMQESIQSKLSASIQTRLEDRILDATSVGWKTFKKPFPPTHVQPPSGGDVDLVFEERIDLSKSLPDSHLINDQGLPSPPFTPSPPSKQSRQLTSPFYHLASEGAPSLSVKSQALESPPTRRASCEQPTPATTVDKNLSSTESDLSLLPNHRQSFSRQPSESSPPLSSSPRFPEIENVGLSQNYSGPNVKELRERTEIVLLPQADPGPYHPRYRAPFIDPVPPSSSDFPVETVYQLPLPNTTPPARNIQLTKPINTPIAFSTGGSVGDTWLLVHLYNDPDSPDFTPDRWPINIETSNTLSKTLWKDGYNVWEEYNTWTYIGKTQKIPWERLSPYWHANPSVRPPLHLYRRPMSRFDHALQKGLGVLLNLAGLFLLLWQPWLKESFDASLCAVLASVLPMIGQWVMRLEKRSGDRWMDPYLNSIYKLDPRKLYNL